MSSHSNVWRPLLALAGILSAFFAPPWVPLACMALLALRYRAWEVLALGLIVDFLWLPGASAFHQVPLFTLAGLVLLWGLEPIRAQFMT